MLSRHILLVARKQGAGLTRAFCSSNRCLRRVAIDEQSNESESPYLGSSSTSNPKSSLALLRQEAEKARNKDLPLIDVKDGDAIDDLPLEADPAPITLDSTSSSVKEGGAPRLSATNAPKSASTLQIRQSTSLRKRPGQRNPFESRSSLQKVDNANIETGLRERPSRAEALAAASASFDEPNEDRPAVIIPRNQNDFALLNDSSATQTLGKKSTTNQTSFGNRDDDKWETRPKRLQEGETRRQAPRQDQVPLLKSSDSGGIKVQYDMEEVDGSINDANSNTMQSHIKSSRAIHKEEEDSRDDIEMQMTRPEAIRIPSTAPSLPRSGRVKLDRDLLEKASGAQWLPFNPEYVDGQREGCAEIGFESWTVFTKIRSNGLRTRLFARRILASTDDCLTFMTALNTSFQQSGGTPDSIFYRSITGKRGSVQVEVAGNLYDKNNDEDYDDHILFRMYPDVSQEQIRTIRQINSVLDACMNSTTPNRPIPTPPTGQQRRASESLGDANSAKQSRDELVKAVSERKEEEKTGTKERLRILPMAATRESRNDVDGGSSRRRIAKTQDDGESRNRQVQSDDDNRSRIARNTFDNRMKSIPSEFGLPSRERKGRSSRIKGSALAEHDAVWRSLSEGLTKAAYQSKTQEEKELPETRATTSTKRQASMSIPSFVKSSAKEIEGSSSPSKTNQRTGGALSSTAKDAAVKSTARDVANDETSPEPLGSSMGTAGTTNRKPIEDSTPVTIDGDQTESNKDVDSIKPVSSPEKDNGDGETSSKPIEEATPVFVDGEQAKGKDAGEDALSTETSTASARGNLEQQAIDSSKEISNQDASSVASSEGSLEEATPVFVDGEQAKDENDQKSIDSKPASISDIQSDSTKQASENLSGIAVQGENSSRPFIDPSTVEEAVKKREEASDNVEEAVKESPLGVVGGDAEEAPVDEATPVAVEGKQVESSESGTSAEIAEDSKSKEQ